MDPKTFDLADALVDQISEAVDAALISKQLANLRRALDELGKVVGPRYSANLTVMVEIFDWDREKALPLLNTGLSTSETGPAFRTWNDSSPQRYLVRGEIQVVPHDHCPKCWEVWDFKVESRTCPHCGTMLGPDCKILLDSDVCPHCEEGKVSMANPICDRCGHEVDLSIAAWG